MPHNLLNTTFCNEPDNSLSAPKFSFYFTFHCVHNAENETRPKSTWRQQSKRRRRRWWYHVRNCKAFQTYWPEEKKDNRRQNRGGGGGGGGSWSELIETLLSSRRAGRFGFTPWTIIMNHNSVEADALHVVPVWRKCRWGSGFYRTRINGGLALHPCIIQSYRKCVVPTSFTTYQPPPGSIVCPIAAIYALMGIALLSVNHTTLLICRVRVLL